MTILKFLRFFLVSTYIIMDVSTLAAHRSQNYQFLNYTVKLYKGDRTKDTPDRIEILQGAKVVDFLENYSLEIVSLGYLKFMGDQSPKPYILIGGYSGGAHCCKSLNVYRLTPKLDKIFNYEGDGTLSIELTMPTGEYILRTTDQSFLYWHAGYAQSANIPLYFKVGLKGFEPCDECRTEYIHKESLLKVARNLHEDPDVWKIITLGEEPFYPGEIVQEIVILLYNNRPDLAQEFLEIAWNSKNPYKEKFKKDLKTLLKNNSYWQRLEKKGYQLPW